MCIKYYVSLRCDNSPIDEKRPNACSYVLRDENVPYNADLNGIVHEAVFKAIGCEIWNVSFERFRLNVL